MESKSKESGDGNFSFCDQVPIRFELVCIDPARGAILTVLQEQLELPSAILAFEHRDDIDMTNFEHVLPKEIADDITLSGILKTSRTKETMEALVYVFAIYCKTPKRTRSGLRGTDISWQAIADLGTEPLKNIDLLPNELANAKLARTNPRKSNTIEWEKGIVPIPFELLLPSDAIEDTSFVTEVASSGNDLGEDDICFCVGDIHGNIEKLQSLFINVGFYFGHHMRKVTIIFLGDYVDRGQDTGEVLEYLMYLQRVGGVDKVHCVCGNHDFALSAFLKVYPTEDYHFTQDAYCSWRNEVLYSKTAFKRGALDYKTLAELHQVDTRVLTRSQSSLCRIINENELNSDDPALTMHIQGRRYAADVNIFTSSAVFEHYGCKYGDRDMLLKVMPVHHQQFIASLPWVVDKSFSFGRIIALHAGLDVSLPVKASLEILRNRDCGSVFMEGLAGRRNVSPPHPSLKGTTTIEVSGHHGFLDITHPNRCIIDESKGLFENPLAGVVFPSRKVIRDSPVFIGKKTYSM
eukprot:m.39695 g.39695  ORF g.39695 m.39695 type:complete len:521 (+) comp10303_c0_seq2:84-1646(+)